VKLDLVTETLYQTFRRSPEEALERLFAAMKARCPYLPDQAFMYQSLMGVDGRTRYGSYRTITRKELETREYKLEFMDGAVGIFWLDVVHDPDLYVNRTARTLQISGHPLHPSGQVVV
jgi:hypothetical protein